MKRDWKIIVGLSVAFIALLLAPMAKADSIFDFSVDLTGGNVAGIVTGVIDLPFASGSGAAASLVLTSIPAGFGALVGGNTVTLWLDQVVNSFTVVSGTITAYDFGADTGPTLIGTDYFAISNSAGSANDGSWSFPSDYNSLQAQGGYVFGQVSSATAVTFSSSIPEPVTGSLMLMGLGLLRLMVVMRKRKAAVLIQSI